MRHLIEMCYFAKIFLISRSNILTFNKDYLYFFKVFLTLDLSKLFFPHDYLFELEVNCHYWV